MQFFIQGNAFENVVCEMAAILSRPHVLKQTGLKDLDRESINRLWSDTTRQRICVILYKIYRCRQIIVMLRNYTWRKDVHSFDTTVT